MDMHYFTSKFDKRQFFKISCNAEYETINVLFLFCYIKIHVSMLDFNLYLLPIMIFEYQTLVTWKIVHSVIQIFLMLIYYIIQYQIIFPNIIIHLITNVLKYQEASKFTMADTIFQNSNFNLKVEILSLVTNTVSSLK